MTETEVSEFFDTWRAELEAQARADELERFAERLSESHRKAVGLATKLLEIKRAETERAIRLKRMALDCGYFYRWIAEADVHEADREDAKRTLEFCVRDLELGGYPDINWYVTIRPEAQEEAQKRFLAGEDESLIPAVGPNAFGFVSYANCLVLGINVLAGQGRATTIRAVAHELRHVWQKTQGHIQPDDRDACAYMDRVYERLVWGLNA